MGHAVWPILVASLLGGLVTGGLALLSKCRPQLAPWLGFLMAALPFSFICLLYVCDTMARRIDFATNAVFGGFIGLFYMLAVTAAMVQWPTPSGLKWIFVSSTLLLTLVIVGILLVQKQAKIGQ